MKKPLVTVLMSVYNGTGYLREQLATILAQKDVDTRLCIRDDGSTNAETIAILHEAEANPSIHVAHGRNLGAAASFYELAMTAPESTWYAFADQDDSWHDDKLAAGVEALEKLGDDTKPLLYFCNYNISDAQGRITHHGGHRQLRLTHHNAILESFSPGCSMVFNRALLLMVRRHLPKGNAVMHDRWFYLTATYLGKVVYDGNAHFDYRQHGDNEIGVQTEEEKGESLHRLLANGAFPADTTAQLFLQSYGKDLSHGDRMVVSRCASYRQRLRDRLVLALSPRYRVAYGGWRRQLYWTLRILLKRI